MRKYLAEFVGTMIFVLMGCGVAVSLNCTSDCSLVENAPTVIGTALAFGLSVTAVAYIISDISGCHINPAVTLGCYLCGRIRGRVALKYALFQFLGALAGSSILWLLLHDVEGLSGTGANMLQKGVSVSGGLIAEVFFTFIFVLTVLASTDAHRGAGKLSGLVIGLALMLVHLIGIRYTGTSVNPARSLAPALFEGGDALSQLWIFIIGPLVGAILAAGTWGVLSSKKK